MKTLSKFDHNIAILAQDLDLLRSWANKENTMPQSFRYALEEAWTIADSFSKNIPPAYVRRQVNCPKCGKMVWELDVPKVMPY